MTTGGTALLRPDPAALVAVLTVAAYLWASHRSRFRVPQARRALVVVAGLVWILATAGPVGTRAPVDSRARATTLVLLLYLVPLLLAAGTPLRVLGGLRTIRPGPGARRAARVLLHPITTGAALLVLPWLYLLGPWLGAADRHLAVDSATGLLLVAVGGAYFLARLQVDPVPRRYPVALSLVISVLESLADGVLGLVLWTGHLLPEVADRVGDHQRATEIQTLAAGIVWIGGDIVGIPFLLALLWLLRQEDTRRTAAVDALLDAELRPRPVTRAEGHDDAPRGDGEDGEPATSQLPEVDDEPARDAPWWESDPQLAERFGHRRR